MLLELLLSLSLMSQISDKIINQKDSSYSLIKEQKQKSSAVPILCYHWVVPENHKILKNARRYAQTTEEFRKTIKYYKEKNFCFLTVNEFDSIYSAYKISEKPKEDTSKYVLITIDDGLKCIYDYAYPILLEEKVKATLFVTNRCVEDSQHNLRLSWRDLKEMYGSGFVDIQSHTYNSHILVKEEDNLNSILTVRKNNEDEKQYESRIFRDLSKSKKEIEEKLGNKVTSIAWPFGIYNEKIIKIAKMAGYKNTFTVCGNNFYFNKKYQTLPRIEVRADNNNKTKSN